MSRPIAVILFLVLFIPCLGLAALIRLDSAGPAIFAQRRIGKNGKSFIMYKFRSMRRGVKAPTADRLVYDERTDPRVTRVGRFMRRTKVDELPQLINVIRGEMSFIGPRAMKPHIHNKRVREVPEYAERNTIVPGMTGFAAIFGCECNLRGGFRDQLTLDRFYIGNKSVWFDVWIVYKTILLIIGVRPRERDPVFALNPAE